MKYFLLALITMITFSLNGQNLSEHLQEHLSKLNEGEQLQMKYAKTGCWGTYEGGNLIYKKTADSIEVDLTNKQNYLGAEAETAKSVYQIDELLETLEENKKSFASDPNNIVLANSFEYKLFKNDKLVASGSSLLEPADVVNKLALSNKLLDSFLGNQKGILKNSGVFKTKGINN